MRPTAWGRRMTDVAHTHPTDGSTLATAVQRGPTRVAADGGRREPGRNDPGAEGAESGADPGEDDAREPTMADVSHTPPTGEGANDVFQRGLAEAEPTASAGQPADDLPADRDGPVTTDGDDRP